MRKGVKRLLFLCASLLFLIGGCSGERDQENVKNLTVLETGNTLHPIEGTGITLRLENVYETEELRPSDPSGYFYYYEDKEGYHYYVISGTLENPDQMLLSPSCFGAAAWSGRKEYETKVVMENSSGATFMGNDDETVGEAPSIYILVMVKDGDEAPDQVGFYYNEGLYEKNRNELWDRGILIRISQGCRMYRDIEV